MKLKSRKPFPQRREEGGGTPKFQETGTIEGLFWVEIFNSGIFSGWKIWQVFFGWLDLSRDFFGDSKQSEYSW